MLCVCRAIVGGRQTPTTGRTPTGSRNQSRESSRSRNTSMERERPPEPTVKKMSEADMDKKTKAIMDEFLHISDMNEAVLCVKELKDQELIHVFVSTALNHVLERSPQARKQTGHLLHDLVKQNILSVETYIKG